MEAVLSEPLGFCDLGIDGISRNILGHGRMEHGVEEGDGVCGGQNIYAGFNDLERSTIMPKEGRKMSIFIKCMIKGQNDGR